MQLLLVVCAHLRFRAQANKGVGWPRGQGAVQRAGGGSFRCALAGRRAGRGSHPPCTGMRQRLGKGRRQRIRRIFVGKQCSYLGSVSQLAIHFSQLVLELDGVATAVTLRPRYRRLATRPSEAARRPSAGHPARPVDGVKLNLCLLWSPGPKCTKMTLQSQFWDRNMAGRMGPGPCPPQSDAESYDEGLLLNSPGAASRWPSRIPLFMLPQARLLRSVLANVSRAGASKGRASSSGVHVATSSNDMATDTTEREAPLAFHLPQEEVPLHGEHSPGWDQKRSGAMEQRPLTPPMEEHTAGMRGSAGPAAPRPRRCTSPGTHGGGSSARVHARAERAGQRPGQLLIERVPGISSTTTPAAHVANRRVLGARVAAGAVGSSGPRASGTAPPRLVLHATHAATQAAEALGTRGRGAMPSASPSPALSCEKRQVAGGAPFTTPNKNDAGTLRWEGDARRGGREGELGAMVKELEEEREEMRRVLVGKEVIRDLSCVPGLNTCLGFRV